MPAKKKTAAPAPAPVTEAIWLITGTDDAVVMDRARELVKKYTPPGGEEFSVDIVEGAADTIDQAGRILRSVTGALQEYGMFGSGKVVWLKDTNVLADTVTGRHSETLTYVEQLLKLLEHGLPEGVTFVMSARDVDKRRTAFLTLKRLANVEIFDTVDISKAGWEEQVIPVVRGLAEARELQFSSDALRLFVLLAGEKTRQISNELEKVDLYLGPERRKVSEDDVRMIVSETHAGVLWELGNAVGGRDLPKALRVLDRLMYFGESAIGILLATIIPTLRRLWQLRELMSAYNLEFGKFEKMDVIQKKLSVLPEEVLATLPQKKDGGLNVGALMFSLRDCGNYNTEELRAALQVCLKANQTLVTGRLESKTVLTMLLLRVLGKSRAKRLPRAS